MTTSRSKNLFRTLSFQYPFDWSGTLSFLRARAAPGVEWVDETTYRRTIQVGELNGWCAVTLKDEVLMLEVSHQLAGQIQTIEQKVRRLFDLDAAPDIINSALVCDGRLQPLVTANPGLRVPGAFNRFEIAMRAILGQQVSVAAARTLFGRLVQRFGMGVETPFGPLTHVTPSANSIAQASELSIAALGILPRRAATLWMLANVTCDTGLLDESDTRSTNDVIRGLTAVRGIGPWTAHYIVMRGYGFTDAFLEGDLLVRRALGGVSAKQALTLSAPWRPHRAYAVMHLWQSASSRLLRKH
jgi:AraC family transcriptional regulator, regulatory protein of adaptative response / DNA-3-methyladenine glycosylase II